MGLHFFERILGKNQKVMTQEVSVPELCRIAEECRARELAFQCCVNLIAGALARSEFRTYQGGEEVFEEFYWILNVSPNNYQNSTAFWHKLIHQLYAENEALCIPSSQIRNLNRGNGSGVTAENIRKLDTMPAYLVADTFSVELETTERLRWYGGVSVGDRSFSQAFPEQSVLHLTLHGTDIRPVLNGVAGAFQRLIEAAERSYLFTNGQHWKVHVDQMASGEEGWAESFQQMIQAQIDPFLNASVAVLPEVDGYHYENAVKQVEDSRNADDIRNLYENVFTFTANAFGIPPVLLLGQVEGTQDAVARFLSACVDPLADQISEEMNRKIYGFDGWKAGNRIRVDTSAINHFDLFANAPNVEKLIGSGYSYNDVQRAAGMPPIPEPWAEAHLFTKNFAKAEEILEGEQTDEKS